MRRPLASLDIYDLERRVRAAIRDSDRLAREGVSNSDPRVIEATCRLVECIRDVSEALDALAMPDDHTVN